MAKWLNGYIVKMKQLRLLLVFLLLMAVTKPQPTFAQTPENPWPMAGGNPQRTSWTPEEVRGMLYPQWYRPFKSFILNRSQIIAANDTLFVSTANGLHALDATTGVEKWTYPTSQPLGHSPTFDNGVVYFGGFDKKNHGVK